MTEENVKVKEAVDYFSKIKPRVGIVKKSESVDPAYGLDVVFVGDKDMKALKDGKALYYSDGEYAHLIVYMGE